MTNPQENPFAVITVMLYCLWLGTTVAFFNAMKPM